ncbi:MAG: CDP-alcohol phosphatidyltransferase family protein [archaeon]|nr:CDP-alcohol phosphatidyltransferase family protein [archaeon]
MLNEHREKFKSISIKVGVLFSKIPLSPNQWTLFSIVPAIIASWLIAQNQFLYAAIFFAAASFLDFVDGSVARVTGRVTKFGAYLDTVLDRYVEFLAIVGLFYAGLPTVFLPAKEWLLLYLFGSMMTTYAKAAAKEKEITQTEIKGGFFERAERLIILFIGLLLAFAQGTVFLAMAVILLAAITNLSALQRIFIVAKLASKS